MDEKSQIEPFDSKKPLVSKMNQEAKEKAQAAIKIQEAENIIKMCLKAGVPKQLIGWNSELFDAYCQANLNHGLYGKPNPTIKAMDSEVFNVKSNWPRRRLAIVVDGGTKESRTGLSYVILSRAILGNFFNLGRVGLSLPFSMLNLKFNSFDNDRQTFITNLLDVPALFISEICQNSGFRSSSDGAVMMDQLLESKGSPVILSLATQPENFEGYNTYGGVFRDLIDTVKTTVRHNDYIWRFSLKTKVPCDDILNFKEAWADDKRNSK